jgi:hypothetical protein
MKEECNHTEEAWNIITWWMPGRLALKDHMKDVGAKMEDSGIVMRG